MGQPQVRSESLLTVGTLLAGEKGLLACEL